MPKVTFVTEKKEIEVEVGANLRQAAMKQGISIHGGLTAYLNCQGNGFCGTCRVLVTKGADHLSPKTTMESINLSAHPITMMAAIGHEDQMRLSCQVKVNGDCSIVTKPAFNWNGENFWQKPYPNK